jgi:hypothetical protein
MQVKKRSQKYNVFLFVFRILMGKKIRVNSSPPSLCVTFLEFPIVLYQKYILICIFSVVWQLE